MSSTRDARRILVLGSSGSGKTHLSERLGDLLGLGVIHLDAHFWLPGSRPRGEREWRGMVSEFAGRDAWIMDGTYERSLDLRLPRADAIVMLECPTSHCASRVMRRQRQTADVPRRDLAAGCFERFTADHARYVWQYPNVTRPAVLASIERHAGDTPVAMLDAPEAVEPFVSQLREATAA